MDKNIVNICHNLYHRHLWFQNGYMKKNIIGTKTKQTRKKSNLPMFQGLIPTVIFVREYTEKGVCYMD